jgi:predicted site-specific integrase-resolvase
MPLILDGVTNYTTKEAAEKLGLQHATLRGVVARGRIAVKRLPELRRNLAAEEERAAGRAGRVPNPVCRPTATPT